MEQAHQRVKIAGDGRVVGSLNLGCPDWRHASTVAAWTLAPDRPAQRPRYSTEMPCPHLHTPPAHRERAVPVTRRARPRPRGRRTVDRRRSRRRGSPGLLVMLRRLDQDVTEARRRCDQLAGYSWPMRRRGMLKRGVSPGSVPGTGVPLSSTSVRQCDAATCAPRPPVLTDSGAVRRLGHRAEAPSKSEGYD